MRGRDTRKSVAESARNRNAGFANDVDAVNQHASPIQADIRQAASPGPAG